MTRGGSTWRSAILWSVVAAAFIGPGTVTTAAKAGSSAGTGLLWALLFSIAATLILQETAARLTLVSRLNLGQIIARRRRGTRIPFLLFGAILLGGIAYQAGNLLGALAGLQLFGPLGRFWILLPAGVAMALLWTGNTQLIGRVMATIVAGMGFAFIWVAFGAELSVADWLSGLLPQLDDSSALLAIGLIGTTIVPYNLFLAAGLSRDQELGTMRRGLRLSILAGGLITLAILVSGTTLLADEFSFPALAEAFTQRLGSAGPYLLGTGLFAAGISSALTAPLATAVCGQTLFARSEAADSPWAPRGRYFRAAWLTVFSAGLFFALLDIQPVPAIIAAQAVNGLLLPFVAIFLVRVANDRSLLGAHTNGPVRNALSLLVLVVVIFLGAHNVWLAVGKVVPTVLAAMPLGMRAAINLGLAILLTASTVGPALRQQSSLN